MLSPALWLLVFQLKDTNCTSQRLSLSHLMSTLTLPVFSTWLSLWFQCKHQFTPLKPWGTYFPPGLIKRKVSSVRAVFDSVWFCFVYSTLTVNTHVRSHHPPFPCLTANRLMPEHLTLFYMQNISASKPGVPQCLTRNTCKGEMGHSKKKGFCKFHKFSIRINKWPVSVVPRNHDTGGQLPGKTHT